jgi:F-box protein 18 (helicase)
VKGFEDYRIAPIMEAYRLYKGENSGGFQDPVLKLMRSWSELADYVEVTGDAEAGSVFRLIEQYKDEIPNIIETLKREQVRTAKDAPFVLTTAHKAKGLEWPVVRLINDFFSFKDPSDGTKWLPPKRIDPQEANLAYVTLTRAMKAVAPTPEMVEWFRQQPDTQHLFPKPVEVAPPVSASPADPEPSSLQRAA